MVTGPLGRAVGRATATASAAAGAAAGAAGRTRRGAAAQRREAVFAALRAQLLERPWAEVTLEAVAKDAGVSRQTLYNSFGSRSGLAQAYTFHLAGALCEVIAASVQAHPGDPRGGLEEGIRVYLEFALDDPLFGRVGAGEAHSDLARLVTTDARPLLERVAGRLAEIGTAAWPEVAPEQARAIASTTARLALSFVVTPPGEDETPASVAAGIASVLDLPAPVAAPVDD